MTVGLAPAAVGGEGPMATADSPEESPERTPEAPMDVEQPEQAEQSEPQRFRGKLYKLVNGQSQTPEWEDQGTGHVSIVGADPDWKIVFRKEQVEEVIHDRPLLDSDAYDLVGEGDRQTIIQWQDLDMDWALSFENHEGASAIWKVVSNVDKFPCPTLANISDIARMLMNVAPSEREAVAQKCTRDRFINALIEVFRTAEDLGSHEALSAIWQIAKAIFLLSSKEATERYLRRDVYQDVLGMLEYDDGLPADKRTPHRQVLSNQVQFRQVAPFDESEKDLLERIHLNYRLQYLKDIVLPRLLDDGSFISLQQTILSNLSVTLRYLQKKPRLLVQIMSQLMQQDVQALQFVQDVCRIAKMPIQPDDRKGIYEKLLENRLLEGLEPFLRFEQGSQSSRHAVMEILYHVSQHDPMALRKHLAASGQGMLNQLVQLMFEEEDQGIQGQVADVFKAVMMPITTKSQPSVDADKCLDVFYTPDGCLDAMVNALRKAEQVLPVPAYFAVQLVCEILALVVANHGKRAKFLVSRRKLIEFVTRLLTSEHRFIQLAALRLVKACVMSKEEVYYRQLISHDAFGALLRSLQECLKPPFVMTSGPFSATHGNLLVSSTLELLEFIRVDNTKLLLDSICRDHGRLLQELAPRCKPLERLLLRHQQNLEYERFPPEQFSSGNPSLPGRGGSEGRRQRSPGRGDSAEDESYFESLDDDDADQNPPDQPAEQPAVSATEPAAAAATGGPAQPAAEAQDTDAVLQQQERNEPEGLLGRSLLNAYLDDEDEHTTTEPQAAGDPAGGAACGNAGPQAETETSAPLPAEAFSPGEQTMEQAEPRPAPEVSPVPCQSPEGQEAEKAEASADAVDDDENLELADQSGDHTKRLKKSNSPPA